MDGLGYPSGFRDLRFPIDTASMSTPNPGGRRVLDSCHVSSIDERPRSFPGLLLWRFPISCRRDSRYRERRYPDAFETHLYEPVPGSPKWMITRHASSLRRTAAILSLFRDLKCPGFLDLRTSDIPSADIPMPKCPSGLSHWREKG
jgi:hypothetical protein